MTGVPGRRPPWKEFRAALDAAGFHPSKKLGQNFLLDENTANAIARDGRVGEGDLVLEVGVGCGFLSTALLATGARLVGRQGTDVYFGGVQATVTEASPSFESRVRALRSRASTSSRAAGSGCPASALRKRSQSP